jgi:hypothetical protein
MVDQVDQNGTEGGTKLGSGGAKVSKLEPTVAIGVKSGIRVDQNVTICWICVTNLSKIGLAGARGDKIGILGDQVDQHVTSGCQGRQNWYQEWPRCLKLDHLLPEGSNWGQGWLTKLTKMWLTVDRVDEIVVRVDQVDQVYQNVTSCWQRGQNWD